MLKVELIEAVQRATGSTKKDAEAAVNAVFNAITEALKNGEQVLITGFGKFEVRERRARTGVNPRNPEQKIQLPASKVPGFKAGKGLKDAVHPRKK